MKRVKSTVKPPSSEDVLCYGTVFVAESDFEVAHVEKPLPVQSAHFGSAMLDASFLSNCLRMLIVSKSISNADWGDALRQVACSDHRSSTAVHIYACSLAIRDLLAELSDKQGTRLADDLGITEVKWRHRSRRSRREVVSELVATTIARM